MGSSKRRLLNQSTHSNAAYSTASSEREGPRVDDLELEQTDDGFGHGIVVGVADAADLSLDAVLGQSLAVSNRQISRSCVQVW